MIAKLKELMERAQLWPEAAQDEAAASLEAIEEEQLRRLDLTDEDRRALARSGEDIRNGRFASDEDVKKFWPAPGVHEAPVYRDGTG